MKIHLPLRHIKASRAIRASLLVVSCLAIVLSSTTDSFALEYNQKNLFKDNIDYFDYSAYVCSGVPGATGEGATLNGATLPATKGGTGKEEDINDRGQIPGKGFVTFSQNVQNASTAKTHQDPRFPKDPNKKVSLQELYRMYYITMRWRYVRWNWNGTAAPGPEKVSFYEKAPRILVTNPATDKSIIAVVLEAGPAPWTGVDTGENNNPKQGWKNPQDGTPSTYRGRVSGFPPQAFQDLGATMRMSDGSGDDLIYSWATDQNAIPGPVEEFNGGGDIEDTSCEETDSPTGGVASGNLIRDTSTMKCPVGKDGGIGKGYANGKLYNIRLCIVHGIDVNVLIAVQINDMLNLAKSQGRSFSGGGFRTMDEQIRLRRVNGCPDIYSAPASSCGTPTARPGYSNHQMGLALDLSYSGNLIRSRSNPGFVWLKQNAAKFGLKNLPSEPWHWSHNGK